MAASALGLLALAFADVAGTGYTSSGDASASMAMAVLTGLALLCYAANLYLIRPPGRPEREPSLRGRGHDRRREVAGLMGG